MAKKVKSEKEVKGVKEQVKQTEVKKDAENKKCCCTFKCFLVFASIKAVLASIAIYHVYTIINHVPAMPRIDVDEYWGPEGTEIKDTAIRPYRIVFTESMLEDTRALFELNRRHKDTTSLENSAWNYGVNSTDFAILMKYWIFHYNFRERPKFLNKFDHFKTRVQGLDLHFMHVKPNLQNKDVKVYPLLLLHGWPGSIRDFYEAIPELTSVKQGYDFVFEVIVPSLPGFIYSEGATRPGLSPAKIAVIMRNLMHRIGHTKFYVQGGDYGHLIGSHMATIFPDEVLGFHTNFPASFSKGAAWLWTLGSIWPSFVAEGIEDRMYPLGEKTVSFLQESGYVHLHATKPDTIGVALQDSPVGLAAYLIDRFMILADPNNRNKPVGGLNKHYSLEKLFDNIMLYWASKSITTSMRLYKETVRNSEEEQALAQIPTPVPTWALRLKFEIIQHSDYILRFKYPNLVGSTNLESGGHFAALEIPKSFAEDIFKAVKSFISFKK